MCFCLFWQFCFLLIVEEEKFKNSEVNKMQRPLIMITRSDEVAPRRQLMNLFMGEQIQLRKPNFCVSAHPYPHPPPNPTPLTELISFVWIWPIIHLLSFLSQNRDAAQKELKQIRQDLMEKKINLTLTKSQKSLATLGNPENIAV